MRPLFTIHAGEYLVGLHIQKRLKFNVWIPAKDEGIDLLVTDRNNRHAASLQIKYGKDFLPEMTAVMQDNLRCQSWFTLNTKKIDASRADFWVFVLRGFASDESDFITVPTQELRKRMQKIHGYKEAYFHSYFCATKNDRAWETRGLPVKDMSAIADGTYENSNRDFTKYLNESGWRYLNGRLKNHV